MSDLLLNFKKRLVDQNWVIVQSGILVLDVVLIRHYHIDYYDMGGVLVAHQCGILLHVGVVQTQMIEWQHRPLLPRAGENFSDYLPLWWLRFFQKNYLGLRSWWTVGLLHTGKGCWQSSRDSNCRPWWQGGQHNIAIDTEFWYLLTYVSLTELTLVLRLTRVKRPTAIEL